MTKYSEHVDLCIDLLKSTASAVIKNANDIDKIWEVLDALNDHQIDIYNRLEKLEVKND